MQEGKVVVYEALKIAEGRKEAKGKGERERYIQLNEEFQRIERRDKKDFCNEQCKDREENNRMGKTRDLFNQIGDINRTFHARMSTLRRDSKNTQKIHTRKVLITQITTMMWSLTLSQTYWSVKSNVP